MKNGPHTHYCPECNDDWPCAAVTHCSLPEVELCPDHFLAKHPLRD